MPLTAFIPAPSLEIHRLRERRMLALRLISGSALVYAVISALLWVP